jgi:hypothetical protein
VFLWNPKNLEYVAKLVNYIGHVRLNGTVVRGARRVFVVNYAIPMMIV